MVVTVVGFPFGTNLRATKVEETKHVIQFGGERGGCGYSTRCIDYEAVYQDIHAVVVAAGSIPVKTMDCWMKQKRLLHAYWPF